MLRRKIGIIVSLLFILSFISGLTLFVAGNLINNDVLIRAGTMTSIAFAGFTIGLFTMLLMFFDD